VWFALAVSLPIGGLFITSVWRSNRNARVAAERTVAEFAERIAWRLSHRLDDFEHLLVAAAQVVEPRAEAAGRNSRALTAISQRLRLGDEANIITTDARGLLVGWGRTDQPVPSVSLGDRPHIADALRGATRVIGRPVRLRNDTTVWGVTMVEPIPGPVGNPVGAIGVTLRLSAIGAELEVPGMPAGAVVQLRDSTMVIGRTLDADAWIGRQMDSPELFRRIAEGLGSERYVWGDGIMRYTAWRSVPGVPRWQVAVGIPVDVVDAPLTRDLAFASLIGVLAIGVALTVGGWMGGRIVRPVRTLAVRAERLAAGDDSSEASPVLTTTAEFAVETSALASAFDTMASRVSERTSALRLAQSNARVLFEQSPVPMMVADIELLTIADANDALCSLLEWPRDLLVGQSLEVIRPPEDVPRWRASVPTVGDGPTHLGQWRYRTRTGRDLDVELVTARAMIGGRGAFLTVITDVTDRRAAERALAEGQEQLRQAQKMEALGRFAGGIAHDFNNLLTAIMGQLEVTLDDLPKDSPVRQELAPVQRSAERMATLTSQILAFGRRQVLQPVPMDLCTVVHEFQPTVERLLSDGVRLALSCGSNGTLMVADRAQVEQVLLNLLVNARDAMPSGGVIRVSVDEDEITAGEGAQHGRRAGPAVRLRVQDGGQGIEPSLQSRVFEPFFTTKPPGKGTGLGLATVYAIVQQHDGVIRLESVPGRGTTFDILWPAASPADGMRATSGPKAAVSASSSPPRETVLVVDDEDTVRVLEATALARLGYTVLSASDGVEAAALAAAYRGPIHLVVTDCVMPRMGGRELATTLREIRPATKVLFMSGHTDDEALLEAIAQEQAAFLPKPFTPGTLAARVREVLDG
jgi:two-component system, cell cycle sensor histidine kinase and response regulator CckA